MRKYIMHVLIIVFIGIICHKVSKLRVCNVNEEIQHVQSIYWTWGFLNQKLALFLCLPVYIHSSNYNYNQYLLILKLCKNFIFSIDQSLVFFSSFWLLIIHFLYVINMYAWFLIKCIIWYNWNKILCFTLSL